jgi:DNA-directed RNA polymerase subunit K/omega
MDPNKEIDDLNLEETAEIDDEDFEPDDTDEEAVGNEIVEDTDDDASIYNDNTSDIMGDDDVIALDDDNDDDDEDDDIDEENALEDSIAKNTDNTKTKTKPKPQKTKAIIQMDAQYGDGDDDEENDDDIDDENDENYLQKFSKEINKQYIEREHPECVFHNYNEISTLSKIIRDKNNNIIDPLHRTIPFLTKYEKTRIIGQRAKQINSGAKPFVNVPQHIIDGYIIAELELKQKKIPFIIKRPIPGGGSEYWNVKDLELI